MRIGKLNEGEVRLIAGSVMLALAVLVAGWWAVSAQARAQDRAPSAAEVAVHDTMASPGAAREAQAVSALQVEIDPESGGLRPARGDAAWAGKAQTSGFEAVQHRDGAVGVNLAGHHMSLAVARVGDDGRVATDCIEDAEAIEALAVQEVDDDRR